MKVTSALLAAAMLLPSLGLHAQESKPGTLAAVSAATVSGGPLILPRDLPAQRTLILLAFERDQRPSLATWKKGLDLGSDPGPWFELIVVGPQNAFVQAMVLRGLRRELPEGPARERTVPVFQEQLALAASLGLSEQTGHVLVLDGSGHVLSVATGDYSAEKAEALKWRQPK